MSALFHSVRFYRKPEEPGLIRAVCLCGWHCEDEREAIYDRAALHELEPVGQPKPKSGRLPFRSGLSRVKAGGVL